VVHRLIVEAGTKILGWRREGSGERHVAEDKSPGPDAIWQVSKGVQGYASVGG
jgi:hypothetical protein